MLDRALEVATRARERFRRDGGGYHLTPDDHDAPLQRHVEVYDNATPSGNGAMARLLVRLAACTGDPAWVASRDDLLRAMSGPASRWALAAPWTLDAIALRGRILDGVIAGDPRRDDGRQLGDAWAGLDPSWAVLTWTSPDGPAAGDLLRAPALGGRVAQDGRATAYVCREGACRTPATDADGLRQRLLDDGWR
jgi:uncharacterized protein